MSVFESTSYSILSHCTVHFMLTVRIITVLYKFLNCHCNRQRGDSRTSHEITQKYESDFKSEF